MGLKKKHVAYGLPILAIICMIASMAAVAEPGNGNTYGLGHGNIHANAAAPGQDPGFIPPGQNETDDPTDPEPLGVQIINDESTVVIASEADQNTVPDQPTNEGTNGVGDSESAASEDPSADLQLSDQDSGSDKPCDEASGGAENIDNEQGGAADNNDIDQATDENGPIEDSDGGADSS